MNHDWLRLLRCPDCCVGALTSLHTRSELHCDYCRQEFPLVDGRPVLIRHDNIVFSIDDYLRPTTPSNRQANNKFWRFIPAPSVNLASKRVISMLRGRLEEKVAPIVLVVGGGTQRAWLDDALGAGSSALVLYSDIDVGADVDIFCDGHALPFQNEVFDAVVTTAVLEHVLYPEQVAGEIIRILRPEGWLYSELPFMQQVHEGAYDFTRFTHSGHRRLFNRIVESESGMVAGPGTALVWAIENFLLAFVSRGFLRKAIKSVVRLVFAWLKYFDHFLANKPQAMDGASCTYLFGQKSEIRVPDSHIIDAYIGANHLRHS